MDLIKIIDIIDHQNKYSTQRMAVISRSPEYRYERKGKWLIGEDSGFFSFFYHETPGGAFYAFGGREFDIPMEDGSILKASGQWWER